MSDIESDPANVRHGFFDRVLIRSDRLELDSLFGRHRAVRLANLAQNEKQVLLAGQSPQQRAMSERVELLPGYFEPGDELMILLKIFPDAEFFRGRGDYLGLR